MEHVELEPRFYHLGCKRKDAEKYLSESELNTLYDLLQKVDEGRVKDGRSPLIGVFVQDKYHELVNNVKSEFRRMFE